MRALCVHDFYFYYSLTDYEGFKAERKGFGVYSRMYDEKNMNEAKTLKSFFIMSRRNERSFGFFGKIFANLRPRISTLLRKDFNLSSF